MIPAKQYHEVFPLLQKSSCVLFLDINTQPKGLPEHLDFRRFKKSCEAQSIDITQPATRQEFNDSAIQHEKKRYLIGRYGEDRSVLLAGSTIAKEGRTIHLGIDVFTSTCENVHAPEAGTIIMEGFEIGLRTYGHYVMLRHEVNDTTFYSFFGHLGPDHVKSGIVKKGAVVGKLGTASENGGWSIHLHYQLLTSDPKGQLPPGYCKPEAFEEMKKMYPDPQLVLGKLY